jgi:hypothetical protein
VAPLLLKFGIHQGQTGRKGVRRGEEEGMSRGAESQYIIRMIEQEQRRQAVFTNVSRWYTCNFANAFCNVNHRQLLRYEKNGVGSACGIKNKHIVKKTTRV